MRRSSAKLLLKIEKKGGSEMTVQCSDAVKKAVTRLTTMIIEHKIGDALRRET